MSVEFSYFQELEEEAERYMKKYSNRNLFQDSLDFVPHKVLDEVEDKRVKFSPLAGRYDKSFQSDLRGKQYKTQPSARGEAKELLFLEILL